MPLFSFTPITFTCTKCCTLSNSMPYIVLPRCVFNSLPSCVRIHKGIGSFRGYDFVNDKNRIVAEAASPRSSVSRHSTSPHDILGCCAPLLFSLCLVRARRGLSASAARSTLSFKPRGLLREGWLRDTRRLRAHHASCFLDPFQTWLFQIRRGERAPPSLFSARKPARNATRRLYPSMLVQFCFIPTKEFRFFLNL